MVCTTEYNMAKRAGFGVDNMSFAHNFLHGCMSCGVHAHTALHVNSKWQNIPGLRGKSCFEILHSDTCAGLWRSKANESGKYSVSTSHSAYSLLLSEYGLHNKKRKIN